MEQNNNDNFGSIWQESEKEEFEAKKFSHQSRSLWFKLFIGAFTLVIVASVAGLIFYLKVYFSPGPKIDFSAAASKEIFIGAPFNLKYNFTNSSKDALKNVSVAILLPENTLAVDRSSAGDKKIFTKNLGDLNSGDSANGEISLIIFSDQANSSEGATETLKNFSITAEYSANGVNFEKKQDVEAAARNPAVNFDLNAPEKILNNEQFETSVHYTNVSNYNFDKIRILVDYPDNFVLTSSTPTLINKSFETNLVTNQNGKIVLVGSAVGFDQSFLDMKVRVESFFGNNWYSIVKKSARINFTPSPLSLKITSDASNYVSPDSYINYKLDYVNNTDIALNDVVIEARLNGKMFDFTRLKTDGAYSSVDNSITWNEANVQVLKSISAKTSGALQFSVKLKSQYPITGLSDKNFTVKINGKIYSPTVPYNISVDKTIAVDSLETKVGGSLQIVPQIYFNEPIFTDIINKGSLPMHVNKPINFTVHWKIKDYAVDVSNVVVKSILASGVKFTGVVKSNIDALPVLNDRTGEISWHIDKISANKGVVSKPVEAVFQVEATPSIIDINHELRILQETSILGTDNFADVELKNSGPVISTEDLGNSQNSIVAQ